MGRKTYVRCGVEARAAELWEERERAGAHALDDRCVERVVEVPVVWLGDSPDDEDLVVARDEEDDLVGDVRRDAERGVDDGEVGAVVENLRGGIRSKEGESDGGNELHLHDCERSGNE